MLRAIVGLIKGLVVGGGVGYGLVVSGMAESGALAYVACALVGALVGVVCGRAPWKSETIWTPVVKMIVGAVIGGGLCALGRHFLPGATLYHVEKFALTPQSGPFLATAIGVLYGVFVEIDDGGKSEKQGPKDQKPAGPVKTK
ncbi:MAG: hypothetical protein EXR72_17235 [Myxococcales bacterium]|nr:hypothetical protein [Myxococcales bacterium]